MAVSKNWQTFRQRNVMSDHKRRPVTRIRSKDAFEIISFYGKNPERYGKNWVLLPNNYLVITEIELLKYRVLHNRKEGAEKIATTFDKGQSVRCVRLSNETVEMIGLNNCQTCGLHRD